MITQRASTTTDKKESNFSALRLALKNTCGKKIHCVEILNIKKARRTWLYTIVFLLLRIFFPGSKQLLQVPLRF